MKGQKFVACFDNHGAECDNAAVKAFHEFCKWWKPEVRIHGGDCFDFARLRRNAKEEERRAPLKDDLEAGLSFLEQYKPTHFLRGNHDERMWDAHKSDDGTLSDFASFAITDIEDLLGKAVVMPYQKRTGVLRLGHLKVLHGYYSGVTSARQHAFTYGACLFGHVHRIDIAPVPGLERRIARACGCLCKLDQDYNRSQAQTLAQAHGWVYGILLPGGEYVVYQAEQIAGKWFYASEIIEA
jgi:hypothetical protein